MLTSEICDVHSGYTARGRLEPKWDGVPAFQLRDVGGDVRLLEAAPAKYDLADLQDRYFVSGGEVLFRSRGEPSIAVAVSDALPEPAAVIVPLVIMRPDKRRILPEYLVWAINQPDAQRRLAAEAQGTSIRMVPMSVLGRLDIAVPGLTTQQRIVEADALARREGGLLRELATRREQLSNLVLNEAAQAAAQRESHHE